jgi:hypothetical protein
VARGALDDQRKFANRIINATAGDNAYIGRVKAKSEMVAQRVELQKSQVVKRRVQARPYRLPKLIQHGVAPRFSILPAHQRVTTKMDTDMNFDPCPSPTLPPSLISSLQTAWITERTAPDLAYDTRLVDVLSSRLKQQRRKWLM